MFFGFKRPKLKSNIFGRITKSEKQTVFEYDNDIIIVDCGLAFPEDDMLRKNLGIPGFSYLIKNMDKIRGIVLAHTCREDHIGALPYV